MNNFHNPFNGDHFIAKEFLNLKNKFNLNTAIETGTNKAHTTIFLASHFKTISIEIKPENYAISKNKLKDLNLSADLYLGSSEKVLNEILPKIDDNTIFFLDAHWKEYCPLEDELKAIAKHKLKPIIAIHDFKEPTNTLGYDSYNGQDFTFEWLEPRFKEIYGRYNYYYNTPEKSVGCRRGIIYLTP